MSAKLSLLIVSLSALIALTSACCCDCCCQSNQCPPGLILNSTRRRRCAAQRVELTKLPRVRRQVAEPQSDAPAKDRTPQISLIKAVNPMGLRRKPANGTTTPTPVRQSAPAPVTLPLTTPTPAPSF